MPKILFHDKANAILAGLLTGKHDVCLRLGSCMCYCLVALRTYASEKMRLSRRSHAGERVASLRPCSKVHINGRSRKDGTMGYWQVPRIKMGSPKIDGTTRKLLKPASASVCCIS